MVCVMLGTRLIGKEDEFRLSGGSEFQSRGPMMQRMLVCEVMIGHMEWKERANIMMLQTHNGVERKDYTVSESILTLEYTLSVYSIRMHVYAITCGGEVQIIFICSVWNKLPGHLSSLSTLPAFRKRLKYHLFSSVFPGNPSPSTGITFCDVSPSTDATQVRHTPPPG